MIDGVDLFWEHFPRTDSDYLAQIKKLCTDRCLTVAALSATQRFGAEADPDADVSELVRWIDVATEIGTPLVRLGCGAPTGSPGIAWRELIGGLKRVCAHAKLRNVTLAVQPARDSFVATPGDVRRAFKECDSAWLRLSSTASCLAGDDCAQWIDLLSQSVIVSACLERLDTFGADESIDYRTVLSALWQAHYRGFLSLEYAGDEAQDDAMLRAVTWLRDMVAKAA